MNARIAVVDDQPRMAEVLAMVLRREGHEVTTFGEGAAFLDADEAFDLLLTDLKMPGMDGVTLLGEARQRWPELPVVLITAHATVSTAVAAMQAGAFDYLEKPVDNEACRSVARRALAHSRLWRENRRLRAELGRRYPDDPDLAIGEGEVIAVSEAARGVFELARRAARSRSTVLVTGESGTGKELLARAIHFHSPRVAAPFVAVNCKSLAAGVLESELFGHERGAFTGADRARPGVFERADGGTLFLDEVGEIDLDFQGKLLRVLQEGEVQRVGGQAPKTVDVRVVAATNRDLEAEVNAGRFREDLYFRLAVIPIVAPPLRDRRADVLPLARSFLLRMNVELGRRLEGWSEEVEDWLVQHNWPGNIRELWNTIERGAVLARGDVLELSDLLLRQTTAPRPHTDQEPEELQAYLDRRAAAHIAKVLASCRWVRVEAAQRLGIERTTLYRLMKKYGVTEPVAEDQA